MAASRVLRFSTIVVWILLATPIRLPHRRAQLARPFAPLLPHRPSSPTRLPLPPDLPRRERCGVRSDHERVHRRRARGESRGGRVRRPLREEGDDEDQRHSACAACGIATVVVPLHLASVAPPAIAGSIGILTQVSINVGIFAAQAFSIPFAKPMTGNWRAVPLISAIVALAQMVTSVVVPDDRRLSALQQAKDSEDEEEREPLAPSRSPADEASPTRHKRDDDADDTSLSVGQVLRSSDPVIRKSLWTLVAIMLFQQLSGINAVMYYSTSILTAVNPTSAQTVSLFMTLVNLVMTFPAIFLIDRVGRRTLLVASLALLSVSSAVLGWSINNDQFAIASAGIIAFVVSFALGLGPVPFVLVGEMPPAEAKSATASIAVAVNWLANLAVGLLFLPLRDALARGHSGETGTVFWVFTAMTGVAVVVVARLLR